MSLTKYLYPFVAAPPEALNIIGVPEQTVISPAPTVTSSVTVPWSVFELKAKATPLVALRIVMVPAVVSLAVTEKPANASIFGAKSFTASS